MQENSFFIYAQLSEDKIFSLFMFSVYLKDLYNTCVKMRPELFALASRSIDDKDDSMGIYMFIFFISRVNHVFSPSIH